MAELEAGIIPTKTSTTKKVKRPSKYDIDPSSNFVSSPVPSTYGRFPARGRRGYDESQLSDSDARSMSPDTLASTKQRGLPSRGLLSKGLAGAKLQKLGMMQQSDLKPGEKRPRPLTQHQLAVQEHRRLRVERQMDKMITSHYRRAKRSRYREGALKRAWSRIKDMPDPFAKSDDEVDLEHPIIRIDETEEEMEAKEAKRRRYKYNNGTSTKGPAGLVPLDDEIDDFGEESTAVAAALRRIRRRLPRWEDEDKARRKRAAAGEAEPVTVPVVRVDKGSRKRRGAEEVRDVESDEAGEFEDEEIFEDARENNEDGDDDDDATEEEDEELEEEGDEEEDGDDMEVEMV
ncbi:hypothetical protein ABW19_dt0203754 [Dactylella cylindrospora]|nr:hypothetical protein ABW19_dt0203754 [Dactylella cylindrospora]